MTRTSPGAGLSCLRPLYRRSVAPYLTWCGSIPACAGEPNSQRETEPPAGVYPRVCGGTESDAIPVLSDVSLSPRVRGNPSVGVLPCRVRRSIPACAGEPRSSDTPSHTWSVYPRVCGGTSPQQRDAVDGAGLSPRVRGNPPGCCRARDGGRSIPVCAMEPPGQPPIFLYVRVYPRVCGGTVEGVEEADKSDGLSPRVRGNQQRGLMPATIRRSIPACAGEPTPCCSQPLARPVYPRVCGGTLS